MASAAARRKNSVQPHLSSSPDGHRTHNTHLVGSRRRHNSSSFRGRAAARIARVPFTISHAAAVIPLRKLTQGALPLAALMIGSMSPDLRVFPAGRTDRVDTHSFAGLFWFCWPIGIASWLVFVRVLERPTCALLPESWRSRFAPSNQTITFAIAGTGIGGGHSRRSNASHLGLISLIVAPPPSTRCPPCMAWHFTTAAGPFAGSWCSST